MFAPAPPRCCTRSSTRKESETFSICPSTNCSANRPGKVIRWSVAMEPVTATGTRALLGVGATSLWSAQRPPQGESQLRDAHDAQRRPHRRPGGDHDDGGAGDAAHDARPAEGEPGERDPARPLTHRDRPGLADPGLPGAGPQVV